MGERRVCFRSASQGLLIDAYLLEHRLRTSVREGFGH
jgi:hypothetical protein